MSTKKLISGIVIGVIVTAVKC